MSEGLVVFESVECVVCLEDEDSNYKPGTVFVPCGHCCCCDACIANILEAKLACPLCRKVITSVRVRDEMQPTQPIAELELRNFKDSRRAEYRSRFVGFKSGAGFAGKGKLARSVGAAALSELEVRQSETSGGERMMNGGKAIIQRVDDSLVVDYKVGRSKRSETIPFTELDSTLEDLREQLAGDCISALDVAIYYPEHFWLFRYHKINVEDALQRIGAKAKNSRK